MDIKEALNFEGLKYFYQKIIKPIPDDVLNAYVWKREKTYKKEVLGDMKEEWLGSYYQGSFINTDFTIKYSSYITTTSDKQLTLPSTAKDFKFGSSNSDITRTSVLKGAYVLVGSEEAGSHYKRFYKIDKNATFTVKPSMAAYQLKCDKVQEVLGTSSSIDRSYVALKSRSALPTNPDKSDDYSYTHTYIGTIGQALSKILETQQ